MSRGYKKITFLYPIRIIFGSMAETDSYYNWLLLRGISPTTAQKHKEHLEVLLRECVEICPETFTKFILEKKLSGLRNSSLNWYITTARFYADFANYSGENAALKKFRYFPKQETLKQTLSDTEIQDFLDLPKKPKADALIYERWGMFWKLLAFTGCRPHEIGDLEVNQVDFGRGVFVIEHTKTGVPRNVPIPPNCLQELKDYIDKLRTDRLFLTRQGKVFSYRAWQHDFEWRIKALGIKRKNLTPYSFRHSYATIALGSESVNLHTLAKQLGHSIQMTAKYEHLTTEDVIRANARHPLVRKASDPKEILRLIADYVKGTIAGDKRFQHSCEEGSNFLSFKIIAN